MKFAGRLGVIVLLMAHAGCQTAAQNEVAQTREGLTQAFAENRACREAVVANPAYAHLAEHMPSVRGSEPNLVQMSDRSMASDSDIKVLSDWYAEVLPCRRQFSAKLTSAMPSFLPVYDRSWSENDALYVSIINRKVSWGQAVIKAKEILDESKAGLLQASQTYDARMDARHQQELAQRQAAAQAFSESMRQLQQQQQQQQLINSLNRPVQTNCNTFGNSINCTSY